MKTAYLIKISAETNNNRYYKMYQTSPSTFLAEIGRVGVQPVKRPYPLSAWDMVYHKKLAEGYVDRMPYVSSTVKETYKEIEDPKVRELIAFFQKESRMAVKNNYIVSFDTITPEMIREAEHILSCYGEDVETNNALLCRLFSVIPRKMDQVMEYLLPENASKDQIFAVLQREQELLDVLRTQVQMDQDITPDNTLLDTWNTSVTPVTSEREIAKILEHLGKNKGQFVQAFRVRNKTLDDTFWKNYKDRGYQKSDVHYYYHGTRNMNCLSILKNGLILHPNAPKTGSMFGHGIYLANKAHKSLNYTSLRGTLYAKEHASRGFLFVMKAAYANAKHVRHWSREMSDYTAAKIAPNDALFVHGGATLVNDEIVVYREEQATLQYIIEVK